MAEGSFEHDLLDVTKFYQQGKRVVEATPGYSGPHFTTVAALSLAGVCAPLVFEGAMNGLIFATYVQEQMGPCLRPGAVLVVDNLAAPFGGNRASGDARELGTEALDSFTTARHVHWNLDLEHKPWWFRPD